MLSVLNWGKKQPYNWSKGSNCKLKGQKELPPLSHAPFTCTSSEQPIKNVHMLSKGKGLVLMQGTCWEPMSLC